MDDKDRTLKALEDMKESMAYAVRRRATADVVSLEAQVESLSAQVAAQREEEDRLEHTLALVRMDRDHHYERAEAAEAQVAEMRERMRILDDALRKIIQCEDQRQAAIGEGDFSDAKEWQETLNNEAEALGIAFGEI